MFDCFIFILYDLTNTHFEGGAQGNVKARRGRSKENHTDCPLLTLALVIDGQGFVKTSCILPGNVSEPGTLEETINALQSMRKLFDERLEQDLTEAAAALHTKGHRLFTFPLFLIFA